MIPAENIDDFGQWVNWIVARTKWNTKDQIIALRRMVADFEALVYTAKEVTKATQKILFNNSGNKIEFDPNILVTIVDIIQLERSKEEEIKVEIKSGRFQCSDCKCEGYVPVPHPKSLRKKANGDVLIVNGITALCTCHCAIGREKLINAANSNRFILQIEVYEQTFPGWKREMQRRYDCDLSYSLSMIGLTIQEFKALDEEKRKQIFLKGAKGIGAGCTTTENLKPLYPYLVKRTNSSDDMPVVQKDFSYDAITNGRSTEEHLHEASFS